MCMNFSTHGELRVNLSLRTKPCLSPVFPHLPLLLVDVLAREGSLHSPHNGTAADSTVVGSAATRCRRPCGRLGPYNTTRFPPSSVIPPVLGDMSVLWAPSTWYCRERRGRGRLHSYRRRDRCRKCCNSELILRLPYSLRAFMGITSVWPV